MSFLSSLCQGRVMHQRLRPLRHRLGYDIFMLLLDLDELPALDKGLRLLSFKRFNLFGIFARDYGAGALDLRTSIQARLAEARIQADGRILLLTLPRVLGYAFNPINVYFCFDRSEGLRAVLYEVNNTFGERHSYLIEVAEDQRHVGRVRQQCTKQMHVSPFMDMDMRYDFRVQPPRDAQAAFSIVVNVADARGAVLVARLSLARQPLSDAALLRAFVLQPLLTLKVIVAIHWEALRLWIKGVAVRRHVPAARHAITVIHRDPS